MKISIVIPNYNGSSLLKLNIPRLMKILETHVQKTNNYLEVIIVDDCSKDNSMEIIESLIEQYKNSKVVVKGMKTKVNKGFSSTINYGVSQATGEIIVLLNSDAYPEDDFIQPFVSHFTDEKLYGVGFMDKSIEKEKIVLRGRGVGFWQRGFLVHRKGEVDSSSTLWINGGSCAVRKSIWEKLKGMDELYNPFYWEDIDISYRAQKSGYKVLFEKKCVVVHEHEKGAIAKTFLQKKVREIAFRNQIFFTWLNATDQNIIVDHILWLPVFLLKSLLRFDMSPLKGFISALIILPKVIKLRNVRKSLFVLSDQEIVSKYSG